MDNATAESPDGLAWIDFNDPNYLRPFRVRTSQVVTTMLEPRVGRRTKEDRWMVWLSLTNGKTMCQGFASEAEAQSMIQAIEAR